MYFDDHHPPHFHAIYNEYEALVEISELKILTGNIPSRALGLVIERASLHKAELMNNWDRAVRMESIEKIDPLN